MADSPGSRMITGRRLDAEGRWDGPAPRIMMIGAHPDDCDFRAGGCGKLWRELGCEVFFLSATNGDAGHHLQGGGPLAVRRAAECRAAGEAIGVRYETLDIHDGCLVPSLEHRETFIRAIRSFAPDLLLTHRPWDYHPDHRYTGQLVQDASYLLTVPNLCATTPVLSRMPVILYTEDSFQKPLPFSPDVVVDIDAVIDSKGDMLHAHESQVYEWLARGTTVPEGDAARRAWIRERVKNRSAASANRFRSELVAHYGDQRGNQVQCAEVFEVCEYGAPLTAEARQRLFPF
ncbi:MAG: PIG-L family deacetylase [Fimbriimonadaceae bacterium]|nr:PIG-L family deacetylase [Fimbriimonadaceae bacterium]